MPEWVIDEAVYALGRSRHYSYHQSTMAEKGGRKATRSSSTRALPVFSRLLAFGLVSCTGFAVYANTLSAGFVYDDSRAIVKNRDLLPETPVTNLLYNDFWGTPLMHSGSHRSYRPLCVLSFRLNYAVSQATSAYSYHLVNVMLHAAVCPLYMLVCGLLLPKNESGFLVSFVAGLLFAVHPVHTEAVAGLVGRADVGSAFFFLLAFVLYHRLLVSSRASFVRGSILLVSVIASTASAMFTKEIGITVLGVCLLYDALVHERLLRVKNVHEVVSKKGLMVRGAALTLGGLLLLALRVSVMGGAPPSFSSSDNPAASSNSTLTRVLTFAHLPALNAILLLWPRALSFDWSMNAIPVLESLADGRNLITLAFYGVLMALGLRTVSATADHRRPPPSALVWCTLALVIPFLPAANLFFYVGFVLAERVLYIPSMGYCLLVAVGLQRLGRHDTLRRYRPVYIACVVGVLLAFSARTWQRNADWHDEEALYRSGIKYNPAKAWGNLANILKTKGDDKGAVEAYRNALSYRSNMADAHYNLGVTLQDMKDYRGAVEAYRNAIKCRPSLALGHLNLGIALRILKNETEAEKVLLHCVTIPDTGLKDPAVHAHAVTSCFFTLGQLMQDQQRYEESREVLEKSLVTAPPGYEVQSIYNLLGKAHAKLGNLEIAAQNYRKSLRVKPDHLPAIIAFAQFWADQKRYSDAEKVYLAAPPGNPTVESYHGILLCNQADRRAEGAALVEKALSHSRRSPELLSALADCLRRNKEYPKAISYYKEAAEISPTDTAFSNLGAVYHIAKDYSAAAKAYRRALQINPGSQLAKDNLQRLQNSQNTHASV